MSISTCSRSQGCYLHRHDGTASVHVPGSGECEAHRAQFIHENRSGATNQRSRDLVQPTAESSPPSAPSCAEVPLEPRFRFQFGHRVEKLQPERRELLNARPEDIPFGVESKTFGRIRRQREQLLEETPETDAHGEHRQRHQRRIDGQYERRRRVSNTTNFDGRVDAIVPFRFGQCEA